MSDGYATVITRGTQNNSNKALKLLSTLYTYTNGILKQEKANTVPLLSTFENLDFSNWLSIAIYKLASRTSFVPLIFDCVAEDIK